MKLKAGAGKDWIVSGRSANTVYNFIELADKGFYDGWHSTVSLKTLWQGGDPAGDGTGGPGYHVKGEWPRAFQSVAASRRNLHGPESGRFDTAGSQFFITVDEQPGLDGDYAVFGKVIEGLDVVIDISKVDTDIYDRPYEDVVIKSIEVETFGFSYPKAKIIK